MRETGRPDAAAVFLAAQVEEGLSVEWAGDEVPVGEVGGVVDLDAGVPFKGGCGDVVVVADAEDGWVRVEAGEDWVSYERHVVDCVGIGS